MAGERLYSAFSPQVVSRLSNSSAKIAKWSSKEAWIPNPLQSYIIQEVCAENIDKSYDEYRRKIEVCSSRELPMPVCFVYFLYHW